MRIRNCFLVLVLLLTSVFSRANEPLQPIDPIEEIYHLTRHVHVPVQDNHHERLAQAIVTLYKHPSYTEALHIVQTVHHLAKTHSFKPSLLLGIIAAESSFKRKAKSSHGAIGYTQVVPKWHRDKIRNRDLFNTQVNLEVGALVLKGCLDKHNQAVKKALHCYNGALTPAKQHQYVRKVTSRQQELTAHVL